MADLECIRAVKGAPGACDLDIHAQPGASRSAVRGLHGGALKVAIGAPPVDGAANAELTRFVARELLGLPRSAVVLLRGERGRVKTLRVEMDPEAVAARLLPLL